MDITIVKMDPGHLDAVLEIEEQSFHSPWTRGLFLDELRIEIAQSSVALLQQGHHKTVAGYICTWIIQEECSILRIASHPACRRKGIGRLLLTYSCKKAQAQGVQCMVLEVRPSNTAAVAFYKACGFIPAGIRTGYYIETGEDAVIMIRMLADDVHNHDAGTDAPMPITS
jgi:ribosomal-protein-alanine N-acetyltransferase